MKKGGSLGYYENTLYLYQLFTSGMGTAFPQDNFREIFYLLFAIKLAMFHCHHVITFRVPQAKNWASEFAKY